MRFLPCTDCRRHVSVTDDRCPFCGADAPVPVPSLPRGSTAHLSRAALVLFGAVLAAGCDDEPIGMPEYGAPSGPITAAGSGGAGGEGGEPGTGGATGGAAGQGGS